VSTDAVVGASAAGFEREQRVPGLRLPVGEPHLAHHCAAIAYVRLEVRHPLADRSASSGTSVSTTPTIDPMAALANPVWLGR
jgi:hypothetical protein